MSDIKRALEKAGLKVSQEDQHTLVVAHPWAGGGSIADSLKANSKTQKIALKFKPASIEPIDQFNATLIKL